jgi:hypothetical protein
MITVWLRLLYLIFVQVVLGMVLLLGRTTSSKDVLCQRRSWPR